jgi:hypothetical protein
MKEGNSMSETNCSDCPDFDERAATLEIHFGQSERRAWEQARVETCKFCTGKRGYDLLENAVATAD